MSEPANSQQAFWSGIDLRAIAFPLWRRKWLLIACVVLGVAGSVFFLQSVPDRYRATALVLMDPPQARVVTLDEVTTGMSSDLVSVATQVYLMQSGEVVGRLVDEFDLMSDPEFNPALAPEPQPSFVYRILEKASAHIADVFPPFSQSVAEALSPEEATPAPRQTEQERLRVIENVQARLDANQVGSSALVNVSAVSQDPDKAARLANGLANLFIEHQLETRFRVAEDAARWLDDRIAELETRVVEAENAVEDYRAKLQDREGQSSAVTGQQISDINSGLVVARNERAAAEARYEKIRDNPDALLTSPLLEELRSNLAELQRQAADLRARYAGRHPDLDNLRDDIAEFERQRDAEIRRLVSGAAEEVQIARQREATLEAELARLERQQTAQASAEVVLGQLERKALSERRVYEAFLGRQREVASQRGLDQEEMKVFAPATTPVEPAFPKTALTLALGVALGGSFGLGAVGVAEILNRRFLSVSQLRDETGIDVFGVMPKVSRRLARPDRLIRYVQSRPRSVMTEAGREIMVSLERRNTSGTAQVVLITSALAREGKSSLTGLLGVTAATRHRRVLLIDGDARSPTLHKVANMRLEPGLVDALSSPDLAVTDLVRSVPAFGCDVLPAGRAQGRGRDSFSDPARLTTILSELRPHYDIIIVDSAPLLYAVDTRILAHHADALLFCVRWNDTTGDVVRRGLKVLRDDHVRISGLAMTAFDTKRARFTSYQGQQDYVEPNPRYYVN